jgi:hypothetical protein
MNAPAKGLRTGRTPQVGAVAVLEPGTPGLNVSVDGHVMDVIGVSGSSVTVRDMNWNYKPFQTTTHTLAAGSISGYIYPPGGAAPTTSLAASDMASTSNGGPLGILGQGSGAWWNPSTWFAPAPAYNPAFGGNPNAAGATSGGTPDLNPADWAGAAVKAIGPTIVKGGEVLIGVVLLLGGVWVLVKHSKTGGDVINIATSTAKTGAKLAAL